MNRRNFFLLGFVAYLDSSSDKYLFIEEVSSYEEAVEARIQLYLGIFPFGDSVPEEPLTKQVEEYFVKWWQVNEKNLENYFPVRDFEKMLNKKPN